MDSWYTKHPWLHYCPARQSALCFQCARAYESGSGRGDQESAFTHVGVKNWRKALGKFRDHEKSKAHLSLISAADTGCRPIESVIKSASRSAQESARKNLRTLITTVQFLARQGLALRGHDGSEGNFKELLRLRSGDCPELAEWLKRKENFTHQDIQNELLRLISHDVLRGVVAEVNAGSEAKYFAVIVDGTQDVSRVEQESLCVRFVDDDFHVHEEFLGFFECASSTGNDLAQMVQDALCRLNLPIANLRGMAFDGAANMSGRERGAQAILRRTQPAALFVHCGAHCANLVAKDSCEASSLVRAALACVNELGTMFSQSGKFRQKFTEICSDAGAASQKLRPLCPTRWAVRLAAVDSTISHYKEILATLEELGAGASHLSARAAGLHAQLIKGSTLVALQMVRSVLAPLDRLCRAVQSPTFTVSALLEGVKTTVELLKAQRESADSAVKEFLTQASHFSCDEPEPPRKRHKPVRFLDEAEDDPEDQSGATQSVDKYLCNEYRMVLDAACDQLQARFDQDGTREQERMERLLLSAPDVQTVETLLENSPWAADLSPADLAPQLQVLYRGKKPQNLAGAVEIAASMERAAQLMVPDTMRLLRLLLTLPASSATSERSFSALRRLKTWLRATMTQARLNAVAVCHVHRERVAQVDVDRVAAAFVQLNPHRERIFGSV